MTNDDPRPPADQPVTDPAGRPATQPTADAADGGPSAAGGYRDDGLAAEAVAARRIRELRETTAQLGEQIARIEEQIGGLTEQVRLASGRHADLVATVSENLAPRVAALQRVLAEELGRLRGDVEALLADRQERDTATNPPIDWAALTAEQAAVQWPVLARWIGEVLVPCYELTRNELPDCWALHPPVVLELSWLRTAHVQAYLPRSGPQLAADWHTRWRPAVLARIKELIKPDRCCPGRHAPGQGSPVTVPSATPGAAMPRAQLADPQHWWAFYERGYQHDLAVRRARAAAGKLNWSPARVSA